MKFPRFDTKGVVRALGTLLMLALITMATTAGVRWHLLTRSVAHRDGVTANFPAVHAFLTRPQLDDVAAVTRHLIGLALK